MSPVTMTRRVQTRATQADNLAERVKATAFPPRNSCHPETPSTTIEPVTKAASTVWENSAHSVEFRSTAQKSVSSALFPTMR